MALVTSPMRASSAARRSGVSKPPCSVSRAHSTCAKRPRRAEHVLDGVAAAGTGEVVRILAVGQRGEFEAFAGFEQRQRDIERAIGGAAPGIVAVEAQDRLVVEPPHQRQLLGGERGAERRHGAFVSGHHHGDDVDIAFDRDDARAFVRRLAGGSDVVERCALVKERRLRRVEIFRRDLLLQRAAAEGDHPAAPIADREHDAVAEAVIRHRDIFAGNDQPGLDHVLDRDFGGAQMLLERVSLDRRIAEAEFELGRGGKSAVGEIAAAAGAVSRRKRRLEEPRGELDDVVQRLAALFARFRFGRISRQRHAGHLRQPFDRFRKADALGLHHKVENVAMLAGGEVVVEALVVADRERRRLLLVERRQPLPLPPRLFQFHAPTRRPPKPEAARAAHREIAA